ncbi:hypothetical protein [Rhodanobacter sp. BL-MT-08]
MADLPPMDQWITDAITAYTKAGEVVSGFRTCITKLREQGVIQ